MAKKRAKKFGNGTLDLSDRETTGLVTIEQDPPCSTDRLCDACREYERLSQERRRCDTTTR